jgi:integrase
VSAGTKERGEAPPIRFGIGVPQPNRRRSRPNGLYIFALDAVHKADRLLEGTDNRRSPGCPSVHFHALRHVVARLFIEVGLQPKRIQRIMGHTSITMTVDCYGHLFEAREQTQRQLAHLNEDVVALWQLPRQRARHATTDA